MVHHQKRTSSKVPNQHKMKSSRKTATFTHKYQT